MSKIFLRHTLTKKISLTFLTSYLYTFSLYENASLIIFSAETEYISTRYKSGSLRFSQFSGCWLILSVYIIMSFDFPFVRLFGNFVITLIIHTDNGQKYLHAPNFHYIFHIKLQFFRSLSWSQFTPDFDIFYINKNRILCSFTV
jgi:hypothetical protein